MIGPSGPPEIPPTYFAVWKYETALLPGGYLVPMPKGAKLLTWQFQDDKPRLWVSVNPNAPLVTRTLIILYTGDQISDHIGRSLVYVGTLQDELGLVYHLFDGGVT